MDITQNHQTSKEKIDKLLGIPDNLSIDEFLDKFDDTKLSIENEFKTIDNHVKKNVDIIDKNIIQLNDKNQESKEIAFTSIDESLAEISELIVYSKKIFKHIYTSIISTDLLDSELVTSAAKLLDSIHQNITEFISIYKDRQQFINKIKIMNLQQDHRKEILQLKQQYEIEKLKAKTDSIEVENKDIINYSLEDIISII